MFWKVRAIRGLEHLVDPQAGQVTPLERTVPLVVS
jgi:hypothetical protein